jgi:hypothetical protein
VDRLLKSLISAPLLDVSIFTLDAQPQKKSVPWLTEYLYKLSRSKSDPLGVTGVTTAPPAHDNIETVRAAQCGIVLWLTDWEPGMDAATLSKHGVFTVRFGSRTRTIPFWHEVASDAVTCGTSILWHDRSLTEARVARAAETCTSPGLLVTQNLESPVAAAIAMLTALCSEIRHDASGFERRVRTSPPEQQPDHGAATPPSNFEAARFAAKKLARSAYLRWAVGGKKWQWFIALRRNTGRSITDPGAPDLSGFREIPLPAGVDTMADPFLCEHEGRQHLLFEEVAAGQTRGRLGCFELLPDGGHSEMQIILERPYHLSYPCVVPWRGDLFLLPETAGANRVDLYRFTRFPSGLELADSPMEGVRLVDTTPVPVDGHWYIFTTTREPFMETLLFTATRLDGPWSLHPCNPVSTSVRSCRSAGHLFWRRNRLFRPTQDCSVRYGYAIAVNEVTRLTPHEFEEQPVSYVLPEWAPNLLGTHTWNENDAFQVIDAMRYAA